MKKYNIVAFIGPAGAGKDTVMRKVVEACPNLHEIVSCTTRPMRQGEVHGVNYFYMKPEEFSDKVLHGEMLEASCFNDWFYGTGYESLRSDCINIGVFNPEGIESLLAHPDVDVKVFYVRASDKNRMLRQLYREDDPDVMEIIRRFRADLIDFEDIDFPHEEIQNNSIEDLENAVAYISGLYAEA